jgi:hypothetical protein
MVQWWWSICGGPHGLASWKHGKDHGTFLSNFLDGTRTDYLHCMVVIVVVSIIIIIITTHFPYCFRAGIIHQDWLCLGFQKCCTTHHLYHILLGQIAAHGKPHVPQSNKVKALHHQQHHCFLVLFLLLLLVCCYY